MAISVELVVLNTLRNGGGRKEIKPSIRVACHPFSLSVVSGIIYLHLFEKWYILG